MGVEKKGRWEGGRRGLEYQCRVVLVVEINNEKDNDCIERHSSRFVQSLHELSPALTLKWPGRNGVQIMCNT